MARAFERREVPTENYLLDHPQLAEHWLDGMERLNLGGLVAETEWLQGEGGAWPPSPCNYMSSSSRAQDGR